MQRTQIRMYSSLLLALMLVALSAPLTAQKNDKEKKAEASADSLPAVIWRDPGRRILVGFALRRRREGACPESERHVHVRERKTPKEPARSSTSRTRTASSGE